MKHMPLYIRVHTAVRTAVFILYIVCSLVLSSFWWVQIEAPARQKGKVMFVCGLWHVVLAPRDAEAFGD